MNLRMLWEYEQSLRSQKEQIKKTRNREIKQTRIEVEQELIWEKTWLITGRRPSIKGLCGDKGITKQTHPLLSFFISKLATEDNIKLSESFITTELTNIFEKLTTCEKEIFKLVHQKEKSFSEAAKIKGIHKSTVQFHLRNAENKIKKLWSDIETYTIPDLISV